MNPLPPLGAQRGYVLLLTLGVMTVLGILLASLSLSARTGTAMERWTLEQTRLRAAARAGIHTDAAIVRQHAANPVSKVNWMGDEALFQGFHQGESEVILHNPQAKPAAKPGAGPVTESPPSPAAKRQEEARSPYGVVDEESRLNVNTATPEQLMGIPGFSNVVAEAIVRRRRELGGDLPPSQGAPAKPDAQAAVRLVDGPFRTLEELLAVKGVEEKLLHGGDMARWLTCISTGRVNVNTAPRQVLKAVGLRDQEADKLLSLRRQGVVFSSLEMLAKALAVTETSGQEGEKDKGRWGRLRQSLTVSSHTFRLLAEARNAEGSRAHWIEAAVFLGGDRLSFFQWRETGVDPR